MTNLFLYSGYILLILSVVALILTAIYFFFTGKDLKKKLKDDYGEPWKYNL